MNILYTNARSIFLKRTYVAAATIAGYNIFEKCRYKKYGEVLIYAKYGIEVTKLSKLEVEAYYSPHVEITKNNKKSNLGVVYRPPKQSEEK